MSHPVSLGQAVVYGLVQGLTEFLPVSSSAHRRIVPALFGWSDPGSGFNAVVQLGTMLALVLHFWRELLHVSVAWLRGLVDAEVRASLECRLGWYLILATVPVAVLGLVFSHQIDRYGRDLWLVAGGLVGTALLLLAAELRGARDRDEERLNRADAIVVGAVQALALVPGVSRSGATVTGGLFRGLDRVTAVRFSFLLSVPAVLGAGVYESRKIGGTAAPGMGVSVVAMLVSFAVGLASIAWLLRYVSTHSTLIFVWYRLALGGLLFGLLAGGALSAG